MGELIIGPWAHPEQPHLSKLQLARNLGKSTRTVERWMREGCPHARTREGYARFQLSAVEEWLDERASRAS